MIHSLAGTLIKKTPTYVVIDVGGVGYRVAMAPPALATLPTEGKDVSVTTYLYVQEGIMELYGFLAQEELELFEMLISVSGIGPKSALGVLAVASVDDITAAVSAQDTSILTKVSGVGEKTAQRIIVELKGKVDTLGTVPTAGAKGAAVAGLSGAAAEAIDALVGLGYSTREARDAIRDAKYEKDADAGEIVRATLRTIGR